MSCILMFFSARTVCVFFSFRLQNKRSYRTTTNHNPFTIGVGLFFRRFVKNQKEPEEKADILVSELLGSWGDNELSPECLDGAQRFLKEGGVSIPQEYTSYVAPMSSHKVTRPPEHLYATG